MNLPNRKDHGLTTDWSVLQGVVWDWGDTLMRDIPGQVGPMVNWDRVEAMPGALSVARSLGVLPVRCVATNAQESSGEQVAQALERVGLSRYLSQFFTSGELGLCKPDPEFFAEVARRLHVPAGALLAVGNDYGKDIVPAKVVGMTTVLVSVEADSEPHEAADYRVTSLADLPELLKGWV